MSKNLELTNSIKQEAQKIEEQKIESLTVFITLNIRKKLS